MNPILSCEHSDKACFSIQTNTVTMADILVDTASQANYNDIITEHVAFDWSVDFNTKLVSGSATLDMITKKDDLREVM